MGLIWAHNVFGLGLSVAGISRGVFSPANCDRCVEIGTPHRELGREISPGVIHSCL